MARLSDPFASISSQTSSIAEVVRAVLRARAVRLQPRQRAALHGEGAGLQLVNLHRHESRRLVVQAGAFGEHQFTTVRFQNLKSDQSHDVFSDATWLDADTYETDMAQQTEARDVAVNAPYFRVALKPCSQIGLELGMQRFVNTPSYDLPWAAHEA